MYDDMRQRWHDDGSLCMPFDTHPIRLHCRPSPSSPLTLSSSLPSRSSPPKSRRHPSSFLVRLPSAFLLLSLVLICSLTPSLPSPFLSVLAQSSVSPTSGTVGTATLLTFSNINTENINGTFAIRYYPNASGGSSACTNVIATVTNPSTGAATCNVGKDIPLGQAVTFETNNTGGVWNPVGAGVTYTVTGNATDLSIGADARWLFGGAYRTVGPLMTTRTAPSGDSGVVGIFTDGVNAYLDLTTDQQSAVGVPGGPLSSWIGSAAEGGFTFAIWFRLTQAPSSTLPVLSLSSDAAGSNSIEIAMTTTGPSLSVYDGSHVAQCSSTINSAVATFTPYTWAHLVFSFDANNKIYGWLDGTAATPFQCVAAYADVDRPTAGLFMNSPSGSAAQAEVVSLQYWARRLLDNEVTKLYQDIPSQLAPAFIKVFSVTEPAKTDFTAMNYSAVRVLESYQFKVSPTVVFNNNPSITVSYVPRLGTTDQPSNQTVFDGNPTEQAVTYTAPKPPAYDDWLDMAVTGDSRITVPTPLVFDLTFSSTLDWTIQPSEIYPSETATITLNISQYFGLNLTVDFSFKDGGTNAGSFNPTSWTFADVAIPTDDLDNPGLGTTLVFTPTWNVYQPKTTATNLACTVSKSGDTDPSRYTVQTNAFQSLKIKPLEVVTFFPALSTQNGSYHDKGSAGFSFNVNPTLVYTSSFTVTIAVTTPGGGTITVGGSSGASKSLIWSGPTSSPAAQSFMYTPPSKAPPPNQEVRIKFTLSGDNVHQAIPDLVLFINDVVGISLSYGERDDNTLKPYVNVSLIPTFSATTYVYPSASTTIPTTAAIMNVMALFATTSSVTVQVDSGTPRITASGVWQYMPIPIGTHNLKVISTLSGTYTIRLQRNTPDVLDIAFNFTTFAPFDVPGLGIDFANPSQPQLNYVTHTSATPGTGTGFQQGIHHYTMQVPHAFGLFYVKVDYTTANSVHVALRSDMNVGAFAYQAIGLGITNPADASLVWPDNIWKGGGYSSVTFRSGYRTAAGPWLTQTGFGDKPFPLYCGRSILDVSSEKDDGVYFIDMVRAPPKVTNVILRDATPGGNFAVLTFEPVLALCNEDYTVTVDWIVAQIDVTVTFGSGTVKLVRDSATVLDTLTSSKASSVVTLDQGLNIIQVFHSIDGVRTFKVTRRAPTLTGVTLKATLPSELNISPAPTLFTSPTFTQGQTALTRSSTVGYAVEGVRMTLTFGGGSTITCKFKGATCSAPSSGTPFDLAFDALDTAMMLELTSDKDGTYRWMFIRRSPEVSWTFRGETAWTRNSIDDDVPFNAAVATMNADTRPVRTLDSYFDTFPTAGSVERTLSLNYSVLSYSSKATFATPNSLTCQIGTGAPFPMTSGSWRNFAALTPATDVHWTCQSIVLPSLAGDGVYKFKITRRPSVLGIGAKILDGRSMQTFASNHAYSTLTPIASFNPTTFNYAMEVPFVARVLAFQASLTVANAAGHPSDVRISVINSANNAAFTVVNNVASPPWISGSGKLTNPAFANTFKSTQLQLRDEVSVPTVVVVDSEHDGIYRFALYRRPMDFISIDVTAVNEVDASNREVPLTADIDSGEPFAMRYSGVVVTQESKLSIRYKVGVNNSVHVLDATAALVDFINSGYSASWVAPSPAAVSITAYPSTLPADATLELPLANGPNLFWFDSAEHGIISLTLIRQDATVSFELSAGRSSDDSLVLPDVLQSLGVSPKFIGGILGDYVITRLNLSSTPTLYPDGTTPTQIATTLPFVIDELYVKAIFAQQVNSIIQGLGLDGVQNFAKILGTTSTANITIKSGASVATLLGGYTTDLAPSTRSPALSLAVGTNSFQVASNDGSYRFTVVRASPSVRNLTIMGWSRQGEAIYTHLASDLLPKPFDPWYRSPAIAYTIEVEFAVQFLTLSVGYDGVNLIQFFHRTSPGFDSSFVSSALANGTSVEEPRNPGMWWMSGMRSLESFPAPSMLSQGVYGLTLEAGQNNLFNLLSTSDGVYSINVFQHTPVVQNISVQLVGFDYEVPHDPRFNTTHVFDASSPGSGGFTNYPANRSFVLTLPWYVPRISLAVGFNRGHVQMKRSDDGSIVQSSDGSIWLKSAMATGLVELAANSTVTLTVSSISSIYPDAQPLDGDYTIQIIRAPADIQTIQLWGHEGADFSNAYIKPNGTGLGGVNFTTQHTTTLISDAVMEDVISNKSCEVTVPYAISTLSYVVEFALSSEVDATVLNEFGNVSSVYANGSSSVEFIPLSVGMNLINISTRLSGAFLCAITRSPSVLANIRIDGWNEVNAFDAANASTSAMPGNVGGGLARYYAGGDALKSVAPSSMAFEPFATTRRYYELEVGSKVTHIAFMVDTRPDAALTNHNITASNGTILSWYNVSTVSDSASILLRSLTANATNGYPLGFFMPERGRTYSFVVRSSSDGSYSFLVRRREMDVTNITLWSGTSSVDGGGVTDVSEVVVAPTSVNGGRIDTTMANAVLWKANITSTTPGVFFLSQFATPNTMRVIDPSLAEPYAPFASGAYSNFYPLPQGVRSVFHLQSDEDGDFLVEFHRFDSRLAYVNSLPSALYQGAESAPIVIQPVGTLTNPTINVRVIVEGLPNWYGSVVRYYSDAAATSSSFIGETSNQDGGMGLDFPASSLPRSFTLTCYGMEGMSHSLKVRLEISGADANEFDPTSPSLDRTILVLPRHNISVVVQSHGGNTLLYSREQFAVHFNFSQPINNGTTLEIRTSILCLNGNGGIVSGGSCSQPPFSMILSPSNYTTNLLQLQAPTVTDASLLPVRVNLTFELAQSDSDHYHTPSSVSLPVNLQSTISFLSATEVLGMPHNMSVNQVARVLAMLSDSPDLNGVSLAVTGSTVDGYAVPILPAATPFLPGQWNATFDIVAPDSANIITLTFDVQGEDHAHYIAPAPVSIPVGNQAFLVASSSIPDRMLPSTNFSFDVVLTQQPFGAGWIEVVPTVDNGGMILSASLMRFDATNWNQPQTVWFLTPNSAVPVASRRRRHLLQVSGSGLSAVSPDRQMTLRLEIRGRNKYQYVPFAPKVVTMLSICKVTHIPEYMYLGSATSSSLVVEWVGATHAQIQFKVQLDSASIAAGANVFPSQGSWDGQLFPWNFVLTAPATVPSSGNMWMDVNFALAGADIERFTTVQPSSARINLRPKVTVSLQDVPEKLFSGATSGKIRVVLSEPVNAGSGGLDITFTPSLAPTNGGLPSSDSKLAGKASPLTVSIIEGASEGWLRYTAPILPTNVTASQIVLAWIIELGGDSAHYQPDPTTQAPFISLIQCTPLTIVPTDSPFGSDVFPPEISSGDSYSFSLVPGAGPASPSVGGIMFFVTVLTSIGKVMPSEMYFGLENWTIPQTFTLQAPAIPPSLSHTWLNLSFVVGGSAAPQFAADPTLQPRGLLVVQRLTGFSSSSTGVGELSSTGDAAPQNGTNQTDPQPPESSDALTWEGMPLWLKIVSIALGFLIICLASIVVSRFCAVKRREREVARRKEEEMLQAMQAEEEKKAAEAQSRTQPMASDTNRDAVASSGGESHGHERSKSSNGSANSDSSAGDSKLGREDQEVGGVGAGTGESIEMVHLQYSQPGHEGGPDRVESPSLDAMSSSGEMSSPSFGPISSSDTAAPAHHDEPAAASSRTGAGAGTHEIELVVSPSHSMAATSIASPSVDQPDGDTTIATMGSDEGLAAPPMASPPRVSPVSARTGVSPRTRPPLLGATLPSASASSPSGIVSQSGSPGTRTAATLRLSALPSNALPSLNRMRVVKSPAGGAAAGSAATMRAAPLVSSSPQPASQPATMEGLIPGAASDSAMPTSSSPSASPSPFAFASASAVSPSTFFSPSASPSAAGSGIISPAPMASSAPSPSSSGLRAPRQRNRAHLRALLTGADGNNAGQQ